MQACMQDSAHDKEHVYRVLYTAMDIASHCPDVNYDVLITACLLHDIGRKDQFENPSLCHAQVGAEKAYRFLTENGYDDAFSKRVADCITAHRFRGDNPPQSIEAKILFDADKIDAAGTLGIARTLFYNGHLGEPLYSKNEDGSISDGSGDRVPSFFQEYHYKLKKVYDRLYTPRGKEIAEARRAAAVAFYNSMLGEVQTAYETGKPILEDHLT